VAFLRHRSCGWLENSALFFSATDGFRTDLSGKRSWLVASLLALGLFLLGGVTNLYAQTESQPPTVHYNQEPGVPPDTACRLCHGDKDETLALPSGETLDLGVDLTVLQDSVHGQHSATPLYCTDCHQSRERYLYPHAPTPVQSLAEFVDEVEQNCTQCHQPLALHNPGHLQAEDTTNLPGCTDCHGGHDATSAAIMKAEPIATCQSCHATYADERVAAAHEEIVANLGPEQSCLTCHGDQQTTANQQCKTCHGLLQSQLTLASGDQVDLHVDGTLIDESVHGFREIQGTAYMPLQCTDCHKDQQQYGFPHPQLTTDTRRNLTLEMESICQECHQDIYQRQHDGIHGVKQAEGELSAATCFDCHGNHAIHDPDDPRERVSHTCGNCHGEINEQYAQSVHGAALIGEDNPDVPVCTDCHGVHDISDPRTAAFRVNSPTLCGGCHADKVLMAKYDISTDVFETYVADFHGTTVTLFERQSPDQETNKAVCYDCHGVHNILPATDEHSQVIKDNLLTTCRQCHPDASANFPDSWTSHFQPSREHNPLVYWVNLFYTILIPTVVGGFALFIGTDLYRRLWERRS